MSTEMECIQTQFEMRLCRRSEKEYQQVNSKTGDEIKPGKALSQILENTYILVQRNPVLDYPSTDRSTQTNKNEFSIQPLSWNIILSYIFVEGVG